LSETEPIVLPLARKAGGSAHLAGGSPRRGDISFDRRELTQILNVYGRKVASGEWRDYAIDFLKDRAVFSVFRRASEVPLYRIEKSPKLARRQGVYSVISATGLIVRAANPGQPYSRATARMISPTSREPASLFVITTTPIFCDGLNPRKVR